MIPDELESYRCDCDCGCDCNLDTNDSSRLYAAQFLGYLAFVVILAIFLISRN